LQKSNKLRPRGSEGPEIPEKTGFEAFAGMTSRGFCNWLSGIFFSARGGKVFEHYGILHTEEFHHEQRIAQGGFIYG
jgi:hypothetical protein